MSENPEELEPKDDALLTLAKDVFFKFDKCLDGGEQLKLVYDALCKAKNPSEVKLQKLLEVARGLVYFQDGNGTTLYDLQVALEDLEGPR